MAASRNTTAKKTESKTLYDALFAAQKEMPDLQKNAINPHFGNKYITLDSLMENILPVLQKNGLLLLQFPTALDRDTQQGPDRVYLGTTPALRTKITHVASGESMEDVMPLVLDRENPQGQGSAITYARRYSLMSILGLVADEDDDAEEASKSTKSTKREYRRPAEGAATTSVPSGAL